MVEERDEGVGGKSNIFGVIKAISKRRGKHLAEEMPGVFLSSVCYNELW